MQAGGNQVGDVSEWYQTREKLEKILNESIEGIGVFDSYALHVFSVGHWVRDQWSGRRRDNRGKMLGDLPWGRDPGGGSERSCDPVLGLIE